VGLVDGQQHRSPLATHLPPVAEDRHRGRRPLVRSGQAAGVDDDASSPDHIEAGDRLFAVGAPDTPPVDPEVLDPAADRRRRRIVRGQAGHVDDGVRRFEPLGDGTERGVVVEVGDRVEAQQRGLHVQVEVAEVDAQRDGRRQPTRA
jgi:hypothetical protein